jgi:hypothetical protein
MTSSEKKKNSDLKPEQQETPISSWAPDEIDLDELTKPQ